jgi:hypothetical protein
MTFKERSEMGMKRLAEQPPITLELAIKQAKYLSIQSKSKHKKGK